MRRILGFTTLLIILAVAITARLRSRTEAEEQAKFERETRQLARLSEEFSIQAAGRGIPYINLSDGHDLLTQYQGNARLVAALESNQAKPLSLASADFDEDGVPDLVSGYDGVGGGIVTLLRGNVDAIYPNAPEAKQRRATGTFTEAPFLSPALVYPAPEPADFIGVGDFDGDSHWDVVTAKRGSNKLHLLSGDGKGGLSLSKTLVLPGGVTAMTVGEINRRDGLDDIVVGINGEQGAQVLVFEGPEGALRAKPEAFTLPAEVTSLALGQLDDSYEMDLAVVAGNELTIIYGRDRKLSLEKSRQAEIKPTEVSRRSFPYAIRSIAVGNFAGGHTTDIALLAEDGAVHLLSQGDTGTAKGGRKASRDLQRWESKLLSPGGRPTASKLVCARATSVPVDNLVVVDPGSNQVEILADDAEVIRGGSGESITAQSYTGVKVALDLDGSPATVLPMRLNADALSDLVVMQADRSGVTVAITQAQATFTVTNTNDSGPGSLRQAMLDANANPGADTISFNIGSGIQTINLKSFLPNIHDAVTIDGTTQPGFNGQPIIELNGTDSTPDFPAFTIYSGNSTIRGLVINRVNSNGIDLLGNGNNIIEGNFIGMDTSGTTALGNNFRGVSIGGDGAPVDTSVNNTIGGTTPSARNLISGNKVQGIRIIGIGSTGNLVQGNFIGTDITGTADRGNTQEGIYIGDGRNNTIGGTTPGARNLISGNDSAGIDLSPYLNLIGSSGCLVQGNLIGTDVTGTTAVGNAHEGVIINNSASNNTVGGTTDAARNIISGNNSHGISVGFDKPVTLNQILGNYIGVDISGNNQLGNRLCGIFINPFSDNNTIKDNLIAFNGTCGIRIPNSTSDAAPAGVRISIISNFIHSNGGLGIDLGDPGVTPNDDKDLDGGANLQQNFPVLNSASTLIREEITDGVIVPQATATVSGTFNSTPNTTFALEFYFFSICQSSIGGGDSIGSRPTLLGTRQVTTNDSGDTSFSFTFVFSPPVGMSSGFINSTATDPTGNTSEFCPCVRVNGVSVLTISSVTREGKHLLIAGDGFADGCKILVNGDIYKKTIFDSSTSLLGKKLGKVVSSGDKLRVRNPDGTESNEVTYP